MRNRFPRPCLTCGTPTGQGSYCPAHTKPKTDTPQRKAKKREQYNADYHRLAKHVRETATHCWICGGGPRPHDPWQADHITPGDLAGGLAAAHRSCNAKRGNKPVPPRGREGGDPSRAGKIF